MQYRVDFQHEGRERVEGRLIFRTHAEARGYADFVRGDLPMKHCDIREDVRNATHAFQPDAPWAQRVIAINKRPLG